MPKMVAVQFEPIGVVHSPFTEKRAAPRQGVVAHAEGTIELFRMTGIEHALEDLEGFDRIFVIFHFHDAKDFRPKVLPPRSSVRRGVLATRSPHRPNAIGLSVVRLFGVEGLVLRVGDIDMVEGTPVLDVKPYIPYADAFPNARAGWLDDEAKKSHEQTPPDPIASYEIHFEDDAARALAWLEAHGKNLRAEIVRALALGPAPRAYRRIRKKDNAMELAIKDFRAAFTAHENAITVTRVYSGYSPKELATTAPELHRKFCDRD
jgi:tRNA-Thr(GGU) m(6)t(6)A37 methyltransferase TsaA